MKTRLIFAAALMLLGLEQALAQENEPLQVNAIQVSGSGDVRIHQSQDGFSLLCAGQNTSDYRVEDGMLFLSGSSDYDVNTQRLEKILMHSSGDVYGVGTLKGSNLTIDVSGSGDLKINVEYDTVCVNMNGSGDVYIVGDCKALYAEVAGSGDLFVQGLNAADSYVNVKGSGEVWTNEASLSELMAELGANLERLYDSVDWKSMEEDMEQWGKDMEEWGRKMERWGERFEEKNADKHGYYSYHYNSSNGYRRGFLYDAHWNGFEAGLNMLFNTPVDAVNSNNGAQGMEIRPLRSWYFGFNIADVGVAFDRRHRAGLFTGIGLGWNNFSWNNDITIEYDPENVVYTLVPIEDEKVVKNSKYGALFLQVPLMVEIRPIRRLYVDAGVTGGLRIGQWNRVKFADGSQYKNYHTGDMNLFKLDASLRVGGSDMGFFVNYSLLPLFVMSNADVHPLNFGFSINF